MIKFLMSLFNIGRKRKDKIKVEVNEQEGFIKITSNKSLSDDKFIEIIKRYL